MKTLSDCPVCHSEKTAFAYSGPTTLERDKKLWPVSECDTCGHQFMNPQPSWEELVPYYDDDYGPYDPTHGYASDDDREIEAAKASGYLRHIPIQTGKKLLDVGCGAGRFIRLAKELGAIEQGVEPSEFPSGLAKAQGLNVFCGTLEDFAKQTDEKYDVITANHVIEHVPNPVETLQTMRTLLSPGGFIWIAVPNAAYPINRALNGLWHSAALPFHLMQFSPSSIALAGERAGLKVRRQSTESIPQIVQASIRQYLHHRWRLHWRVSGAMLIFKPIGNWYAKKMDYENNGEAILTEFVQAS